MLFGCPPARGCRRAQQHAPDSWRGAFLSSKHADASVLSGVYTSCRAGRDLVLSHAQHATLSLDATTAEQLTDTWLSPLQRLSQRGTLPTGLKVTISYQPDVQARVQRLLEVISQRGYNVDSITLRTPLNHHEQLPIEARVLQCQWPALPSVKSLRLQSCNVVLPPRSLPNLAAFEMMAPFESQQLPAGVYSSIAALLPQLTSFSFSGWQERRLVSLFPQGPNKTLPTLTHLSLRESGLTDELLGLVLDTVPALQELAVSSLRVETDAYRARTWPVTRLVLQHGPTWEGLARLPRPASGCVCVESMSAPSLSIGKQVSLTTTAETRM